MLVCCSHHPTPLCNIQPNLQQRESRGSADQPLLEVREIWQGDPGISSKSLTKRARAQVTEDDAERRLDHVKGLQHQGEHLRATDSEGASTWANAVLQLPPQVMKFSLNGAQDTLPHNANLALWRSKDGVSDACRLCGIWQTLPHVLNQCPVALTLRCYNTRHDAVLQVINPRRACARGLL